jgi:hypothetical protein
MLETTEKILKDIRQLRDDTADLIISGQVKDMEHYKFLMGRLDGYKMVESAIRDVLSKGIEDEDF